VPGQISATFWSACKMISTSSFFVHPLKQCHVSGKKQEMTSTRKWWQQNLSLAHQARFACFVHNIFLTHHSLLKLQCVSTHHPQLEYYWKRVVKLKLTGSSTEVCRDASLPKSIVHCSVPGYPTAMSLPKFHLYLMLKLLTWSLPGL
jgi:pterin-4a-carbinolamine dehydratase